HRTVMVTWDMKGTYDQAKKKIDRIEAAVNGIGERHPGFYVGEAGSVSSGKALDKMFVDQLKLAGERSIPITIVVLLLVFGALVAVGIPLLLALSSVIATVFLVALPSQLVPMDQNVDAVVLLIVLAVGVDYSFYSAATPATSARRCSCRSRSCSSSSSCSSAPSGSSAPWRRDGSDAAQARPRSARVPRPRRRGRVRATRRLRLPFARACAGRDVLHRAHRPERPHRLQRPDLARPWRIHGDRRLHVGGADC